MCVEARRETDHKQTGYRARDRVGTDAVKEVYNIIGRDGVERVLPTSCAAYSCYRDPVLSALVCNL